MKRVFVQSLMLLVLVVLSVGGYVLWRGRPWRTVVSVNGHLLTSRELDLRAQTLLDDANRTGSTVFSQLDSHEASLRARRRAAKAWVVKEILLAEALERGFSVTSATEKEALAQMALRLKGRGLTPDQFFQEGPLPEDLKRRDFQEAVLINELTNHEVRDRISVSTQEIEARMSELQKSAHSTGRTDVGRMVKPSRTQVLEALRAERFQAGFRRLFRSLHGKFEVRSSEFPELETLEGISPSRPEDEDAGRTAE